MLKNPSIYMIVSPQNIVVERLERKRETGESTWSRKGNDQLDRILLDPN
jgi:hypothetical protein